MNIGKVSVRVNNTGLESVARTNGNDATVKIMLVKGPKGDDGGGLPSGGTTGQVLAKHSDTSQDAEWKTLTASDVGALAADGAAASVAQSLRLYVNDTPLSYNGSTQRDLRFRYISTYCPSSLWSNTTDASGYYTAMIGLGVTFSDGCVPSMFCVGSSSTATPTAAAGAAYNLVEKANYSGGTLTLYSKTKPTETFYFVVKGISIS